MKTSKAFSAPWVAFLGIIALVVAAGTFFFLKNASLPVMPQRIVSVSPSPVGTTTWSMLFPASSTVGQAPNLDAIGKQYDISLTQAQADYLEKNKFLLVPMPDKPYFDNTFDAMLAYFDSIGGSPDKYYRTQDNVKFVTPDIMLQAYHDYFDLTLSEVERTELYATLDAFLSELIDNIGKAKQMAQLSSVASAPDAVVRYENLYAQMAVAKTLLETSATSTEAVTNDAPAQQADQAIDTFAHAQEKFNASYAANLPGDLADKARQELKLIYGASQVTDSPLWGQYTSTGKSDYTQFTPRSHYTKNSRLRAYFRSMMYLGRNSYQFGKDVGIQDARLLAGLFAKTASDGKAPLAAWQRIMNVTSFYVGQSDDVTYPEWKSFLQPLVANPWASGATLSTSDIKAVRDHLSALRPPKIFSDAVIDASIQSKTKADLLQESLGLRVFGQKFTFDAWVFADLTAGQEKTETRLPSTPSALFIPAAFGDQRARSYVDKFLTDSAGFSLSDVTGFMAQLDKKIGQFKNITQSEWMGSLGSGWLDVLSSLTHQYGSQYPLYMQSDAFPDKQIQTFLGSYAELKHDTLLYAKQNYAELGGGGDEPPVLPPVVKGFVEPNMDFWRKLLALIDRTQQMFKDNNVFQNSQALARLQTFRTIVAFSQSIAQKELDHKPISEAEYETLRTMKLSFMAEPLTGWVMPDQNAGRTALVADVSTDMLAGKVLYEATGNPYVMLAYVDSDTSPRVVVGLAFNHYEFTQDLGKRMTDEQWRGMVYDHASALPEKNFWYQSLIAP